LNATANLVSRSRKEAIRITPVTSESLAGWLSRQGVRIGQWVRDNGFGGAANTFCLVPGRSGQIERVLAGIDAEGGPWAYSFLPTALPAGLYALDAELEMEQAGQAALGWALAGYVFDRYKKVDAKATKLVWPAKADRDRVRRTAEAVFLVRDLVNTPTEDLGPAELAARAQELGKQHGAKVTVTAGDALLRQNYPLIHAVGRASAQAPRLIDLRWQGSSKGARIALVGKGVVFDSGGLDIKPPAGMKMMKKDMGGSAHVLGLAHMIMDAQLPVRLRVLVPAVENAVSGNAFRPLDIIRSRKGLTVEIGNTDAEGRLILCDAITEAVAEPPDLLVDFATLTGAARIALGPDLPAFFCNDEGLAGRLEAAARVEQDPVWRLPLFRPYRKMLDSPIADLNNAPEGGLGGAITAALFLAEFVPAKTPWIHFDINAWNTVPRPGRPLGGEAGALRAMFRVIEEMAGA
jgi:leucyl aminopeptidase